MDASSLLRGLGFVLGGALLWVLYFDLKDRLQPEPRRLLVAAFGLGMGAAAASALAYEVLWLLGVPVAPGGDRQAILAVCLLAIGPIEEGAKFAVLAGIVARWRAFDEPIDGIIYAAAVAIGFAALENLLYLPHLLWWEQAARAGVAPFIHSLFSAVYGYGLSRSRFGARTRAARWAWPAGTLLLAAVLHGLYDYAIFARHVLLTSSAVVVVLWAAMLWALRRLTPRPVAVFANGEETPARLTPPPPA